MSEHSKSSRSNDHRLVADDESVGACPKHGFFPSDDVCPHCAASEPTGRIDQTAEGLRSVSLRPIVPSPSRMSDIERQEANDSIASIGPGYPPITDTPKDWGRQHNAKCLVRGHSFEHDDEDYIREDGPGDVCGICGYVWPEEQP